jgi:hypothetical protein
MDTFGKVEALRRGLLYLKERKKKTHTRTHSGKRAEILIDRARNYRI